MFTNKGQGSLEYLLILGGAILVAVIIIAAITLLPNPKTTQINALAASCSASVSQEACQAIPVATGLTGGAAASCPASYTGVAAKGCCWNAAATADKRCVLKTDIA